jgi:hypothetical protein
VWGGHASLDEIKMLKAICVHMRDPVCRARAEGMLKKKQETATPKRDATQPWVDPSRK